MGRLEVENLMNKVNNRKVINRIADKMRKAQKIKNFVAIFSIILTTIMFTALFTIGTNILNRQQESTMRMVGGSAHAGYKYLTSDEYEIVKRDSKIQEVSYHIAVGYVVSEKLKKINAEASYYEELDAQMSFCYPDEGEMPQEENEIVLSDIVLDALKIPHEVGYKVPLVLQIGEQQVSYTFILSGYYEGDPVVPTQVVCVSKLFQEKFAPAKEESVMQSGVLSEEDYIGRYMVDFNFTNSFFLDKKVSALSKRCGFPDTVDSGINWAYTVSELEPMLVVCIIVLLFVIFFAGYLIIYNIFYISVYADIRYYGLLKTIGTTESQLRQIVRRQAYSLSLIGIPLGLLGGILIAKVVLPYIMNQINFSGIVSTSIDLNWGIFAGSSLFSFFTVYVSCIKPCRLVSSMTPVEAVKTSIGNKTRQNSFKIKKTKSLNCCYLAMQNVQRNKKKVLIVVMSLSLALVLLNSIYTFVQGYDIDKFLMNEILSDYSISDVSLDDLSVAVGSREREGVPFEFIQDVYEQNGVEEVCNIYISDWEYELRFVEEDWIKLSERVFSLPSVQEELQDSVSEGEFDEYMEYFNEEREIDGAIYGMGELACRKLENLQGEFEWDKFNSGDYVIVNRYTSRTTKEEAEFFCPGEQVTLFNLDGESKKYTVMAVADIPYAIGFQAFSDFDCDFILSENEFLSFYGQKKAMRTLINVNEKYEESFEQWLENYCTKENLNLDYTSKGKLLAEFETDRQMYVLVGGVLVFILALIGILNFVNTITTSIMSRKQELSMMEAVGMTRKQQRMMLIYEGMIYLVLTMIVGSIVSVILSIFFLRNVLNSFLAFSYHFTVKPMVFCVPAMLLVSVVVPICCHKFICKTVLVERMSKNE